jgi:hypothetical protein
MRAIKGEETLREGVEPSKRNGDSINIVVVAAHLPPGNPRFRINHCDRAAQTEEGEVVGIWTNTRCQPDFFGDQPWFWVAKSRVSGLYYLIHPMDGSPRRSERSEA